MQVQDLQLLARGWTRCVRKRHLRVSKPFPRRTARAFASAGEGSQRQTANLRSQLCADDVAAPARPHGAPSQQNAPGTLGSH